MDILWLVSTEKNIYICPIFLTQFAILVKNRLHFDTHRILSKCVSLFPMFFCYFWLAEMLMVAEKMKTFIWYTHSHLFHQIPKRIVFLMVKFSTLNIWKVIFALNLYFLFGFLFILMHKHKNIPECWQFQWLLLYFLVISFYVRTSNASNPTKINTQINTFIQIKCSLANVRYIVSLLWISTLMHS